MFRKIALLLFVIVALPAFSQDRPKGEWVFNMFVGVGNVTFRADVEDDGTNFRFRVKGTSQVKFVSGKFENEKITMTGTVSVGDMEATGTLKDNKISGTWEAKSGAMRGNWSAIPATPRVEMTQEERVKQFTDLWTNIRDRYIFFKDKNLSYDAILKKYLDQVKNARDDKEFYTIIRRSITELNDGHASLVATPTGSYPGKAPYDVRYAEGKVIVVKVQPDAEKAGLKVGDVITEINGKSISKALEDASKERAFPVAAARDQRASQAIGNGELTEPLKLKIKRGNETKEIEVSRIEAGPAGGDPSEVKFEDKGDGIGYIKVASFLPPTVGRNFAKAMDDAVSAKVKSLIIDMRGNGGGALQNVQSMIGRLLQNEGTGTAMWMRGPDGMPALNPASATILGKIKPNAEQDKQFSGTIVLLIDELSFSATEVFAAVAKENKLVTIFGRTTGGGAGAVAFHRIREEAVVAYSLNEVRGAGGTKIEGNGVAPDFQVPLTIDEALGKRDLTMERAKKWLMDQMAIKKAA